MTGFICHDDYYDRLKRLSDEEVGHLFRMLMLYHAGREEEMEEIGFIENEGIAFDFIKDDIDRMEKKASETSETNRLNGMKGGRPKKQTEANESEENRQKPTETEANQTKPYKDKDKDKENKKREREQKQVLFDRFWSEYPRKESKPAARRAFEKLNVDETLLATMLAAIEKQKASPQWIENGGKFIPHPATWLNNNRWEDEIKPVAVIHPAKKITAQEYEQRDYSGVQEEILDEQAREIEEKLKHKAEGA